eukprot:1681353-Ditylum_brightwellii.AAC.1
MTVCIDHSTNINPSWISRTQYQEHINLIMEATVQEKLEKDAKYYKLFNTNMDHAKSDIQLHFVKLNVCHEGKKITTNALSIYTRLNFANLALDLLQDISSIITTKSMLIVDLSPAHDTSNPDIEEQYCRQSTVYTSAMSLAIEQ